ncbi:MAG: N-acetylmuramoyl-L-alanine amidase, partial [Muribaculaceae bacterium]|nr:N-acetylmuramoyl-L-alanine amidase [Muribaculaceae bacterium]
MKKLILLAVAAIMAAGTMQAKTADEVRIYINPGHGSWGPNDRPMATIPYPNLPETGMPDTCGFYESNTNLWKCLKLYDVLQNMGVKKENLMMSRVKNGPYPYTKNNYDPDEIYNRPLSEIAREVDANNMDMFISVHSNAHTDGASTNYPAIFYSGYDQGKSSADYDWFNSSIGEKPDFTGDRVEGSYEMCQKMWGPHYMDEIDPNSYYSRTNPCIRGDISFWSG